MRNVIGCAVSVQMKYPCNTGEEGGKQPLGHPTNLERKRKGENSLYEITTLYCDTKQTRDKNGRKGRSINGGIGLKVPRKIVEDKCKRYMRKGKPMHRAELLNESDFTIIATYQLEYRGLVNYYRMAYNLYTLSKLRWVMEQSLTRTLASKHKISVRKVYKKYKAEVDVEEKNTRDYKPWSRVKGKSHS